MYPRLSTENGISRQECNRVCNAIALMQTTALDPATRHTFLRSHILGYIYPLLNTIHTSCCHEYLRLSSLGLLGALVRTDSSMVVSFFITSKLIPICLTVFEHGGEMSMTVAAFIIQKVLEDHEGLLYMTNGEVRLSTILMVLANLVNKVARNSSTRLLKHVLRCYVRIADHEFTHIVLREKFPRALMDHTFEKLAEKEPAVFKLLKRLSMKLNMPSPSSSHFPPESLGSQGTDPSYTPLSSQIQ